MYGLLKRIKRLLDDFTKLIYQENEQIIDIEKRDGKIEFPCKISTIKDGFKPFSSGDYFSNGHYDSYALFRFEVDLPQISNNEELFLYVATNQDGHNMIKPQALIYVDDKALQGLDINHTRVNVTEFTGQKKVFYVYGFNGRTTKSPFGLYADLNTEIGVKVFFSLQKRNSVCADLYFNIKTAYEHLRHFAENSLEYQKILHAISDTFTLLDLRVPYSQQYYKSVEKANAFIKETLYSFVYAENGEATLIGHTHIDLAWLWQYAHTKDKVLRSFATEIKLLEEFPEHRFFSSQAQLYQYVKEQDSDLYARIKEKIKNGQWEADGAMWVEPDMNLTSGESIIRQILYGKRFFKDEFGVDCEMLWLPDVFGYSSALPQILKKSGITYFLTAKLGGNELNRFPFDTFIWKGIDGSEVFSHLFSYLPGSYCPQIEEGEALLGMRNYAQKNINQDILLPFGFADGGGGPTMEQIETIKRLKNGLPGVPKTKIETIKPYMKRLENCVRGKKELPVWNGELYFERHRGTYTSMGRVKRQNRKCEFLYQNAEWLSVMANSLSNTPFPKEDFDSGIKKMLLNQFHDVLPGSSVKEVYEDSDKLYEQAFGTANAIIEKALGDIMVDCENALSVFNPYCEPVSDYVEYNGQFYYVENVPAKGVMPFIDKRSTPDIPVVVDGLTVENQYYKLAISNDGYIQSLFDKRYNRECFLPNMQGNQLRVFEDRPGLLTGWREDNWNLDAYYSLHEFEISAPDSIEVIENNGEYAVICVSRRYCSSVIKQNIIVYARSPRIDFETVIDWKENEQVLKVYFPVAVNTVKAKYEVQFGHIERPTTKNTSWEEAKFEVCGHKWADISDAGYGMALLNDCKYGYSADGSTLSLTLLRCGDSPNPDADKEVHKFTYSILPHRADCIVDEIVKQGYMLNNPLFVKRGSLKNASNFSLFSVKGAVLDTVKMAEDLNGYVLRLYEPNNRSTLVEINSDLNIKEVYFTDILENKIESNFIFRQGRLYFEIMPFEIVTLKVFLDR